MPKDVSVVRKWGNSRVVVIPGPLIDLLKWKEGDMVHLDTQNGALVLTKLKIMRAKARTIVDVTVTDGDTAEV